jgi:hypothetical protein
MYEFDRATPVTVTLRAQSGLVEIVAEERLTIEVRVTPFDDSPAAREAAAKTRVELDGDTLLIHQAGSETWSLRRTPKLRITARVPAGSVLAGKSASSDVRAGGVWSAVRLSVSAAEVDVAEVTGDADLEASTATITVARVGGSLRAKNIAGRLLIGDVTDDVSLTTASGDIRLHSAGGSVRADSASGSIEVGELREGRADLRTASGSVEVGVAAGTGVWMDLNTLSGRSVSDLTAQGDTPATQAGLELRVRSVSGDIHVHRAHTGAAHPA